MYMSRYQCTPLYTIKYTIKYFLILKNSLYMYAANCHNSQLVECICTYICTYICSVAKLINLYRKFFIPDM